MFDSGYLQTSDAENTKVQTLGGVGNKKNQLSMKSNLVKKQNSILLR